MSPYTLSVIAVVSERLIIVISGLVSILLGWRLFVIAITLPQTAALEFGQWRVDIKNVGPGIFFSLFGTMILSYALLKPAAFDFKLDPSGTMLEGRTSGIATAGERDARSYVAALNTVIQIDKQLKDQAKSDIPISLTPSQIADLNKASEYIADLRRVIVRPFVGGEALDEWFRNERAFEDQPQTLPDVLRKRLSTYAPWFKDNVVTLDK